ncbi:hypothetical protein METBIDRAFT_31267 [Metschnikowia bicuspidata var. bicuspidata NRRL YB-4993]|uniref:Uncharacterized protein n=1 Tax=Metschnikowia bicuspidata var. bicuspidata NRRL YB-4993 TaxID=869754 RepID=A0A1A0HED1_9ASCO|nr:hypothetical protein METBIDRAFT_31267 [Metschnikowia bicuspidata var. bicuspidata NRRL YB-4993]OBA22351.1 hypothetical protein METBIDRAFT_31267 [Metschnikowia bicuspidata var. bicuspidata NRRL YB-4993]
MLGFYQDLLDMESVRVENPHLETIWHEDVHKLAVHQNVEYGQQKAKFMRWFLFDLLSCEGKYTHTARFGLNMAYTRQMAHGYLITRPWFEI